MCVCMNIYHMSVSLAFEGQALKIRLTQNVCVFFLYQTVLRLRGTAALVGLNLC